MTTRERRRIGRMIRRNRRHYGPEASIVLVTLEISTERFVAAVEEAAQAFDLFARASRHRRQILHNGRKPR